MIQCSGFWWWRGAPAEDLSVSDQGQVVEQQSFSARFMGLILVMVMTIGLVYILVPWEHPRTPEQVPTATPTGTAAATSVTASPVSQSAVSTPTVQQDNLAQYVLQPVDINYRFSSSTTPLPWVTLDQLVAVARFLLTMEGDPRLRTDDDTEAFELLHGYLDGSRELTWRLEEVPVPGAAARTVGSLSARMAYSCSQDVYAVTPVRATTELLALSFYHEIGHAVQCERKMREFGITNHAAMAAHTEPNPCVSEPRPYAAQIRMFVAMYEASKLPKVLGQDEHSSDADLLVGMKEVWNALLSGQEYFCTWYRKILSGSGSRDTSVLKEVPPPAR